ncbi:hypothetical protein IJD34_03025 [bacterium]|nr:hypothetical protein [bacterium]
MNINLLNYQSPSQSVFKAKSLPQKFMPRDFYIRIPGYGRNPAWAEKIVETAEDATIFIKRGWSFENIIKIISLGVAKANRFPLDVEKRIHTGILRIEREGWQSPSSWKDFVLITNYDKKHGNRRYTSYETRLDEKIKTPLKEVYKDISLTKPKHIVSIDVRKTLYHGASNKINEAFRLVDKLYSFLLKKYLNKPLEEKDLNIINNCVAQMRWILAHSTPWERGSDAISNVFMKSVYKALNIKTYPPAKGISFDMEAFCTDLAEYRKNFPVYFEKPPRLTKQ